MMDWREVLEQPASVERLPSQGNPNHFWRYQNPSGSYINHARMLGALPILGGKNFFLRLFFSRSSLCAACGVLLLAARNMC